MLPIQPIHEYMTPRASRDRLQMAWMDRAFLDMGSHLLHIVYSPRLLNIREILLAAYVSSVRVLVKN